MARMAEMHVTATDFRRCIAQIKNAVAYRQDRVVMTLHGRRLAALVSIEDFDFLCDHRPNPSEPTPENFPPGIHLRVEKPPPPKMQLPDPWTMPLEEVKALYAGFGDGVPSTIEAAEWVGRAAGRLNYERSRARSPPQSAT
jgi:prevent-host-death family protein